jgi:arylsulfatase A
MPLSKTISLAKTCLLACAVLATQATAASRPNVVVIFIDDLGYADIGPFGAKAYPTPNLDRMAAEGRRFTDFVASSAVCSASRAALMTGCYHARVNIHGAYGPNARAGIHADEVTLGELCQRAGYATACFGKWHLGDAPQFLPLQNGFDEYLGLPYSNDMWPFHPTSPKAYPPLPLIGGNQIINAEVTGDAQKNLTKLYTEHSVDFIQRHKQQPFFLYVPHSMVHVPLYVSQAFEGKSGAGLFGDAVMEVDWSVGQILDSLRHNQLEKNTLVIFTGDNGPWLSYGDHAGSAAPLREGKGTMWEGGYREPTIAWWPGTIPANTTCDELSSTIDVLPTVAKLMGASLPTHAIDGKDLMPLLRGDQDAKSPHDYFYCYYGNGELQAVRDRQWKLIFPHTYRSLNGKPGGRQGVPTNYLNLQAGKELYDLKADRGETTNRASEFQEVVTRLEAAAEVARSDLGDSLTKRQGTGVRPAGRISN